MGDKSKIEWTEASWNPVVGCSRVSAGCDHCYAMGQAHRIQAMGTTDAYDGTTRKTKRGVDWTGVVRCLPERLDQPIRWKRPRRIFVNSMSDLFHPSVPDAFIARVFHVMAQAKQHTFQILTKRPERAASFLSRVVPADILGDGSWMGASLDGRADVNYRRKHGSTPLTEDDLFGEMFVHGVHTSFCHISLWPLGNVWIGTSVEDQATADERIPHLLRCPSAVRWLSCEPLLGTVDLSKYTLPLHLEDHMACHGVHWVVVGGESGPKARPFSIDAARQIVSQCRDAGVPVFVKQLGRDSRMDFYEWADWCDEMGWWQDEATVFNPSGNEWSESDGQPRIGSTVRVPMRDPKGGDLDEWPEDLRVREYPDHPAQVQANG